MFYNLRHGLPWWMTKPAGSPRKTRDQSGNLLNLTSLYFALKCVVKPQTSFMLKVITLIYPGLEVISLSSFSNSEYFFFSLRLYSSFITFRLRRDWINNNRSWHWVVALSRPRPCLRVFMFTALLLWCLFLIYKKTMVSEAGLSSIIEYSNRSKTLNRSCLHKSLEKHGRPRTGWSESLTFLKPKEFSIKLHTIKSGWSIVYIKVTGIYFQRYI